MTDNKLEAILHDDDLIDNIEDLPGFVTPPTGAYLFELSKGIEDVEINDKSYYKVNCTYGDVVEVHDKHKERDESTGEYEALPKAGDIVGFLFDRSHELGRGSFKNFIKPIATHFNCSRVGEARQKAIGLRVMITLRRSYNKKTDRYNMQATRVEVI